MLDTLYLRNTPPRFHNCVTKRLAVIHEGSYPTNRNISIPNKTLLILHQEACPYSPRKHKITAIEVLFAKDA